MKKFFLISLTTLALSLNLSAQTPAVQMQDGDAAPDTIVNTGSVNLDVTLTGDYDLASFQLVTTKISGTVAGTCPLQASIDGVNYFPINTVNWYGGAPFTDTATVTNVATFTYTWTERPVRYRYYRLATTGSGTSAYTVKGYVQPRKQ